jgi:WD40 repeat protein
MMFPVLFSLALTQPGWGSSSFANENPCATAIAGLNEASAAIEELAQMRAGVDIQAPSSLNAAFEQAFAQKVNQLVDQLVSQATPNERHPLLTEISARIRERAQKIQTENQKQARRTHRRHAQRQAAEKHLLPWVHTRTLQFPDKMVHVAFSPDGTLLLATHQGGADLVRIADGEILHSFRVGKSNLSLGAFSPDGSMVITGHAHGGLTGEANLWRVDDGAATLL